jgi:hypothetical protein
MAKTPTYVAYSAVERAQGGKSRWREVGAAFAGPKGSLTVLLDVVPLNGKVVLLPPKQATAARADADE